MEGRLGSAKNVWPAKADRQDWEINVSFALVDKRDCNLGKVICQTTFSKPELHPHIS